MTQKKDNKASTIYPAWATRILTSPSLVSMECDAIPGEDEDDDYDAHKDCRDRACRCWCHRGGATV